MPLKNGTWKVNVNGNETTLVINAPGADASISGYIGSEESGREISGYWDEVSKTISFHTVMPDAADFKNEMRSYRGYLFSTPPEPSPGQDVVWTLAGDVQANSKAKPGAFVVASSRRTIFGWFAQISEIL